MDRSDCTRNWQRWVGSTTVGMSACGGLALWVGFGSPFVHEVWQGFSTFLALDSRQAVAVILGLAGG